MKIVWSPLALERVGDHADFIATDNVRAAERWVDGLFGAVTRLSRFPESGRPSPDVYRAEIREIVYSNSVIIYRVEAERVVVLTVRHQRQILDESELEEPELVS